MRWTLISFLCIIVTSAFGQKTLSENVIQGKSRINIGLNEINRLYVPPASNDFALKSAMTKECDINVTYVNFPAEAKVAFEFAVGIWEQNISSSVPINILAVWEKLGGNELANCQAATFQKNFPAAPLNEVYYPIALVEKLMQKEMNGTKDADIICEINSSASWYFGTNGDTPDSKYDLVTVALHEIAHGLGISGFFDAEAGEGKLSNHTNSPSAYDYFVFNIQKQRIADHTVFGSPSKELYKQLTSDNLNFNYFDDFNVEGSANIFAPTTWNPGGSIYHLKSAQSGNRELMAPFSYKGQAIHNPGENTLHILSEIGWNAIRFKMAEIDDMETTTEELPVETKIATTLNIDQSSAKIIFSYDYFKTSDTIDLVFNNANQQFEGKLPINYRNGNVQYYYTAKTDDNRIHTFPNHAPSNMLNFKIGPDYYPPTMEHNPVKLISASESSIEFSAIAKDNLGINSVKVEYRINGVVQEPVLLNPETDNIYNGKLNINTKFNSKDVIEYRIIAEDNSARNNKKYLPSANSFYTLEVVENLKPIEKYISDFDSYSEDFAFSDFEISTPSGFTNNALHSLAPYTESQLASEKQNLIAQLKYPVILKENGEMTFDEIVLVEPGEMGSVYTDDNFWDFVIVEASTDFGKTWNPLVDGYDSGLNENWANQFSTSLKSNISYAAGNESMYKERTISLTENNYFNAGDTVVIRFRLSSDNSVNGWGWAIDNLKIQNNITDSQPEMIAAESINIYPNPFSNNVFIDCNSLVSEQSSVDIKIMDMTGKTVYSENNFDIKYNPQLQVDLSSINPGIYLASITDENYNTITRRIIKN
ncbi:MAG: T9SS type A sorting domain-containing protein [Prolixibacteraceae bacterium]|nr:T9SS type A sorting domain-containing protein [Prolixibacteraceae bacterium]